VGVIMEVELTVEIEVKISPNRFGHEDKASY